MFRRLIRKRTFLGLAISAAAILLCLDVRPGLRSSKDTLMNLGAPAIAASPASIPGPLSSLFDRSAWLNSSPLGPGDLRGKVVLVNFWTYSCINSLRPLPYLRAWAEKYEKHGLVVVGVHTPEFGFEHEVDRVRLALQDHGLRYPVLLDNDYGIWRRFGNNAWPGFYFIGADGKVRSRKLGEGDYAQSEELIRTLLVEAGADLSGNRIMPVQGEGIEAAPDWDDLRTPETYVGYAQAVDFASPGGIREDRPAMYQHPLGPVSLNHWSLGGNWRVGQEFAATQGASGTIRLRFHARDLHLVMGLSPGASPVNFRVTIDGAPPGTDHGTDVDSAGLGQVQQSRLYQLVRQTAPIADRIVEIEFFGAGVRAFSFTFG